jgi:hypothetical protein
MDPQKMHAKMENLNANIPRQPEHRAEIKLQDKEEIKKVGPHCRKCKQQVFPASMTDTTNKKGTAYKKGSCPTCTGAVYSFPRKSKKRPADAISH